MKSRIFIVALLAFFAMSQAQVTFKPGIRGGVNISNFSKGEGYSYYNGSQFVDGPDYEAKTDFYFGIYGALRLGKYYTLQPELDYSRQGATITYDYQNGSTEEKINISYLCMSVTNKFTLTDKFNIHLGPTLDIATEKNEDIDNDIDVAFYLGVGYNITKNFGLEARAKNGIVSVAGDGERNVVYSLGAAYTFGK